MDEVKLTQEELEDFYLDGVTSKRFDGWFLTIFPSVVLLVIWIFSFTWNLTNKIILTIIAFIFIWRGISKLKKSKENLKKYEEFKCLNT